MEIGIEISCSKFGVRVSSKKQNLLAMFTFEETDFQSKTNTFSMDTMVFSGYIRFYHYILTALLLIYKLLITYDTTFMNQICGLQDFCHVEKTWQQVKCWIDRDVL